MKKIIVLSLALLTTTILVGQNGKQFILNNKADLEYSLPDGAIRDTISLEEIILADSLVNKYVLENHAKYSWTRRVENYYEYHRQYAGYRTETPEKAIFINAFFLQPKEVMSQYLKETLISYKGGGSNFFTIKVNLKTQTCFDLMVNAPK
ncbi:MAG TPA: hypothetical protein VIZ28_00100 [Chitinophagaceae bacterium]